MIAVFYDDACDALWVSFREDPFMPGTLMAERDGDTIMIRRCVGADVLAGQTFDAFTRRDGSGFPDAASALAYLNGEFAKRPAVRTINSPYPLTGAASFAINHGLPYVPSATVLDPDGVEVDTDVAHAPGLTTLTFAQPFTGTLYLG